jgi:hypothetical protein
VIHFAIGMLIGHESNTVDRIPPWRG